jgi:hypothetical protein
MRRIWLGCCARAPSGETAVALPRSVMKSRRLIRFPAIRDRAYYVDYITFQNERRAVTSDFAREADFAQICRHVSNVPTTGSRNAANKFDHSITSSARAKIVGGIVNPSALAVIRLMTSSNLVLC